MLEILQREKGGAFRKFGDQILNSSVSVLVQSAVRGSLSPLAHGQVTDP